MKKLIIALFLLALPMFASAEFPEPYGDYWSMEGKSFYPKQLQAIMVTWHPGVIEPIPMEYFLLSKGNIRHFVMPGVDNAGKKANLDKLHNQLTQYLNYVSIQANALHQTGVRAYTLYLNTCLSLDFAPSSYDYQDESGNPDTAYNLDFGNQHYKPRFINAAARTHAIDDYMKKRDQVMTAGSCQ